jgi:hypothetical protein
MSTSTTVTEKHDVTLQVTKKGQDSVLLRRQVKKVTAGGKILPQTPGPQSHNPGPPENLANALAANGVFTQDTSYNIL